MSSSERFNLPPELENDQQAAVLYSPFREMSLNPQSWKRKMKFWENLLSQAALERRSVTVDVNALPLMFERKGMRPKCLGTVIQEMKKSGRIKPVEDYEKCGWLTWGLNTLVKSPIAWSLGQLLGSNSNESSVYVWPDVVKKLCEEVVELYQANVQNDLTDNVISLAGLRSLCQSLIPSEQDFNIVLAQLERDKKIAIMETQDKQTVIKFCKTGDSYVNPIREIDLQIFRIQQTIKKLEEEIEVLSARAKGQIVDARTHLREGRKTMAKHCLRKKKAILRTIDQRSGSLSILLDTLQSIEEARTNEMVVKACASGVAAMKTINKDLNVESVEATMDNIREAIDNQEEINQSLISLSDQDDNEQLEKDLEDLLSETDKETEQQDDELRTMLQECSIGRQKSKPTDGSTKHSPVFDDLDLPSVPTHSPQSYKGKTKAGSSSMELAPS